MKYLFELSLHHKTLSTAEVLSILKAENIDFTLIESTEEAIIIETKADKRVIKNISQRLSHTFFVDEYLFAANSIVDLEKNTEESKIKKSGSIAIKYTNRSKNFKSQEIVKLLANLYTKNRVVKLKNPDIEVRALITDSKIYVGLKLLEINRSIFEERKVQFRPFFSPITLHPKIARVLANLSEVKKGDTLLDPFCGTGGILLEAGLMDVNIVGSDVEEKMIDGCKKTLDYYNIKNYNVFCSDIGDISSKIKKVDAVVCDLPYGKSTTTKGEETDSLYQRSFESINNILKPGKKLIIGFSDKKTIVFAERFFILKDLYEIKAHRSLTRYFGVFETQP